MPGNAVKQRSEQPLYPHQVDINYKHLYTMCGQKNKLANPGTQKKNEQNIQLKQVKSFRSLGFPKSKLSTILFCNASKESTGLLQ